MFKRCDEKTKKFLAWIHLDNLLYSNELCFPWMTYLEAWSLSTVACPVELSEGLPSLGIMVNVPFVFIDYFSVSQAK